MRDTEKDENVMVFETSDGGKNNTHTHQSEIMTKLMDLNSNILVFLRSNGECVVVRVQIISKRAIGCREMMVSNYAIRGCRLSCCKQIQYLQ